MDVEATHFAWAMALDMLYVDGELDVAARNRGWLRGRLALAANVVAER